MNTIVKKPNMSFSNVLKETNCIVLFDVNFQVCGTLIKCCSMRRELLLDVNFLFSLSS